MNMKDLVMIDDHVKPINGKDFRSLLLPLEEHIKRETAAGQLYMKRMAKEKLDALHKKNN